MRRRHNTYKICIHNINTAAAKIVCNLFEIIYLPVPSSLKPNLQTCSSDLGLYEPAKMSHTLLTVTNIVLFALVYILWRWKNKTFRKLGQCVRTQNWLLYHRISCPTILLVYFYRLKNILFSMSG